MKLADTGLRSQPFQTHGTPLILVPYTAQKAAIRFLNETRFKSQGLGLFHGPPLSGKTCIIQQFTTLLPDDYAVAVVDGAGMRATALLQEILSQFGYDHGLESENERFSMLRVFAMQQAASNQAPLLIIENAHAMGPLLLEMLCELAELTINGKSALRIILASDRAMLPMVGAPAMQSISKRVTGKFLLQPLTQKETANYVYRKLLSGGCKKPQAVVPQSVCERLHVASGGWPGIIDRLALMALSRADRCPLRIEHIPEPSAAKLKTARSIDAEPRLIISHRHRTLKRTVLRKTRLLIGRSELCDLHVTSDCISRQHAMLFRNGSATIVVDLNSKHGTFVNGKRVAKHVLINNDIISVGDHRIKFMDPSARRRSTLRGAGWDDTTIAKSITDFRNALAKQQQSKRAS
jgi:type II secretory pathway predicted ATPase ExeA